MEYNSYEVTLVDSLESDVVDSVSDVKVENGTYTLLRDSLVLFTAPIEKVFCIKVL